jgi:predicted metallopeptidase
VSENFDRLSGEDKIKTIMHELLHIPQGFGGGFRHHRPFVNRKNVETFFCAYKKSLQL